MRHQSQILLMISTAAKSLIKIHLYGFVEHQLVSQLFLLAISISFPRILTLLKFNILLNKIMYLEIRKTVY